LKLVHIVRQFSPSVGGLEVSVLCLARVQREHFGIDAQVITLDRAFGHPEKLAHVDNVDGVPVRRLPWFGSSRYPVAISVLQHLKTADVVHVHGIDFFFDFLALTRPLHGRTMIASTHGGFFHTPHLAGLKKMWFNTVTRLSIQAYTHIVACSHSDAALFESRAGNRLRVIENGIDPARLMGASAQIQTKTIICFGRFAQHKRIGQVFLLLAQLLTRDSGWRLIVAGRDADQTTQQLLELAKVAGVADATRFEINPSDTELRALIGEASYFACLSAYEGFGLAAVEAMSAGLLPLLSGIAPFQRLVAQSHIGIIIDPDDLSGAAKRVQESLVEDPASYAKQRAQVIAAVRRYDWGAVAIQYSQVYAEAIAATGNQLPAAARLGSEP
jgi:alpha-1,3-mannosyltransferase